MHIKTPAKINLVLKVLDKRKDGYHNINSIMQKVELFDSLLISVEKNNKLSINIETKGFYVPSGEDNLCYKAIKILSENINKKNHVCAYKLQKTKITIKLTKNIPVSAGLAGGSSNAAGVLICLNKLLGLDLNRNELVRIAALIGSDVPFFIHRNPACYVKNKGDKIGIFPQIPCSHAILVKPDFNVSTKCAYNEFDTEKKQRLTKNTDFIKIIYQSIKEGDVEKIGENLYNDLEAVVASKHREIYKIKKKLLELGALGSIMSGSGPTVFGLIENEKKVKKIYDLLRNSRETRINKWWLKKVRLLTAENKACQ